MLQRASALQSDMQKFKSKIREKKSKRDRSSERSKSRDRKRESSSKRDRSCEKKSKERRREKSHDRKRERSTDKSRERRRDKSNDKADLSFDEMEFRVRNQVGINKYDQPEISMIEQR